MGGASKQSGSGLAQNRLIRFASAIWLASTMLTAACSDYSSGAATGGTAATTGGSSSTGGTAATTGGTSAATGGTSAATGGSANTGGTAATTGGTASTGGANAATGGSATACTNVMPCGGDVVGTWTATSSCLKVSGELDLTLLGLGCTAAPISGTRQVTGTWTAKADGTFMDSTIMTGSEQLMLPASCLAISGTMTQCDRVGGALSGSFGYTVATCVDAAGGGCVCTGTLQQTGGMGVPVGSPSVTGQYTTAANEITATGSPNDIKYSYCVAGSTMTVTPKNATTTGTIVLQKQ